MIWIYVVKWANYYSAFWSMHLESTKACKDGGTCTISNSYTSVWSSASNLCYSCSSWFLSCFRIWICSWVLDILIVASFSCMAVLSWINNLWESAFLTSLYCYLNSSSSEIRSSSTCSDNAYSLASASALSWILLCISASCWVSKAISLSDILII